jgi:hypothetical protein
MRQPEQQQAIALTHEPEGAGRRRRRIWFAAGTGVDDGHDALGRQAEENLRQHVALRSINRGIARAGDLSKFT